MAPRRHPPKAAALDPLGYDLKSRRDWAWNRLEKLAASAESENVRFACLKEYISRLDPVPSTNAINATLTGPVVIQWQSSPSDTPLALSSGHSTTLLPSNGHGRAASSSTDALESL